MGMDRLSVRDLHSRHDHELPENGPHLAGGGAPAACSGASSSGTRPTKTSSRRKRSVLSARPADRDGRPTPAAAEALARRRLDPLDKRQGGDTIFSASGSEGPRLMVGISV